MSVLFLKRFLSRPRQVASIVPSSRALVRKVTSKMDFSRPRVIAEYGAGEGCHTREMLRRSHADSHLLLFELDAELAEHLKRQFEGETRVSVHHADAAALPQVLASRGFSHCDYVVSGIPFSLIEREKKRGLLQATFDSLAPHDDAAFIIYQVTNELRDRGHCQHFPRAETEYCLANIPPMFVTKFYKTANGHARKHNGHSV
jgi:phosphatidylethanolamine/phosphatidyl-N-methylethanolamine N-methyltransferase